MAMADPEVNPWQRVCAAEQMAPAPPLDGPGLCEEGEQPVGLHFYDISIKAFLHVCDSFTVRLYFVFKYILQYVRIVIVSIWTLLQTFFLGDTFHLFVLDF